MKFTTHLVWVAAVAACVAGQTAAHAQGPVTTEQLLSVIQEQQRQINELKARLGYVKDTPGTAAAKAETVKQQVDRAGFPESVKVGGLIEVEATNSEAFSGADGSDITIAKVELYADAQPLEYLSTHVQLLHEDGASQEIVLDEAWALMGNAEKFPVFVQGGKWAMPFGGDFVTDMSTDPLTKSLGEVKEAAVMTVVAWQGLSVAAYAYNGDTRKLGESEKIDQFGFGGGYAGRVGDVGFSVAGSYVNNLADSDALTDALGSNASLLSGYVAGGEVHGELGYRGFTLRGAYMTALDSFQSGELAFNGSGAKPAAWGVEFVYGTEVFSKGVAFAATVQGTEEALGLSLPKTRYGIAATVAMMPNAAVTAEYLYDKDYGIAEGGTGESGHTGTVKLAVEF